MKRHTWQLYAVSLLTACVLSTIAEEAKAQGNPFPQNAEAASDNFGTHGQRSDDPDQWEVCDEPQAGAEIQCWHLKTGSETTLILEPWEWAQTNKGDVKGHHQTVVVEVEEASIRPDWANYPTQTPTPEQTDEPESTVTVTPTITVTSTVTVDPTSTPKPETPVPESTPFPDVPVNKPLATWPETKEEVISAFSPAAMQQIAESEITSCNNNAGDCWQIVFTEVRPVSIPKGAKGQIGPNQFFTEEGRWVLSISIWADWQNLPHEPDPTPKPDPTSDPLPTEEPKPIPQNPQLQVFPQTAEKAAEAFGVDSERSAQADQWSQCDNWQEGQYVVCWQMKDGPSTSFSLPKGANTQIWDGRSFTEIGPWTGFVGQVTVRPQWEDIEGIHIFIPLAIRN